MQIRQRGASIEFLRSEYNPLKKRSGQKMIGSMPFHHTQLPAALRAEMTAEEIAKAEAYLQHQAEQMKEGYTRSTLYWAQKHLRELAQAVEEGTVTDELATTIYAGLDQVAQVLQEKGHRRQTVAAG